MALSSKRAAMAIAATMGLMLVARPAAAYTVYVSNEKGNSITVLDSETLEVEETIPVGNRPRGIILTNDDKYLLICAGDEDTVQMLDVKSRQLVGDLPSGPDPGSSQRRHSVDQCCGLHIERVNFRMRFASAKFFACIASMNCAARSRTFGSRERFAFGG